MMINTWNKTFAGLVIVVILSLVLLTGCGGNARDNDDIINEKFDNNEALQRLLDDFSVPDIISLEEEINDLKEENENLKEKLSNVKDYASYRTTNYSDILDNIQNEAEYDE